MAIGACDICDRQNVPVRRFEATAARPETSACFSCLGEEDPILLDACRKARSCQHIGGCVCDIDPTTMEDNS